ncbi:MAG: DNA repair protein RadC [Clostridiales bacterium]|nr:DNA repair protein RadC [Clostridiales bacterium]
MKARYKDHGLDNFNDVNVLELLLFYAIPRKDTNEIAHALLEHFGSLDRVLEASIPELEAVPGVGESSALLISLIPQIMRRYLTVKGNCVSTISGSADAGRYLVPRLMFEKDEKLLLLCLDAKKSVISCINLGSGVVNAVDVNVRKVVENAVRHRANTVILAHNHPGGVALPSREDERLTIEIAAALKLVGIPLVDHIIVAGDDYVSFADSGMMGLPNG